MRMALNDVILLVLCIVAVVVVALRFWARKIQKSSFELSDYLIVLGLVTKISQPTFQPSNGIKACTLTNNLMYFGILYWCTVFRATRIG